MANVTIAQSGLRIKKISDLASTSVDANVKVITVEGYNDYGDTSFKLKRRTGSPTSSEAAYWWYFQSQDGAYWEGVPSGKEVRAEWFGADPAGVLNSAPAINAAINYVGLSGGGTVRVSGTLAIWPTQSPAYTQVYNADVPDYYVDNGVGLAWHAIIINWDNVALIGDSMESTQLKYRIWGGLDPANNWLVHSIDNEAIRGSAIGLSCNRNPFDPVSGGFMRRNILIKDMEIWGGTTTTQTLTNGYCDPVTGLGWDSYNHAINLANGARNYDGITIENCRLHGFRGEIVYGGGGAVANFKMINCKVHGTDADGVSVTAISEEYIGNEFYDCSSAGIENYHAGPFTDDDTGNVYHPYRRWQDNYFHDMYRGAISIGPADPYTEYGTTTICGNYFYKCGINVNGAGGAPYTVVAFPINAHIHDNTFRDCYVGGVTVETSAGGFTPPNNLYYADGLFFHDNIYIIESASMNATNGPLLNLNGDNAPNQTWEYWKKVYVVDNVSTVSDAAYAAGIRAMCIYGFPNNTFPTDGNYKGGVTIKRNYAYGGRWDGDTTNALNMQLLTTTGDTTLATLGCWGGFVKARLALEVANASTDVTAWIMWDYGNVTKTKYLVGAAGVPANLSTGHYDYSFSALHDASVDGHVYLHIQAGTANNVTATAEIEV